MKRSTKEERDATLHRVKCARYSKVSVDGFILRKLVRDAVDLAKAEEEVKELKAQVIRLESLCGKGLEEITEKIMSEPPPEWIKKLEGTCPECRKKMCGG